jgi:signal transduction histidine kinase
MPAQHAGAIVEVMENDRGNGFWLAGRFTSRQVDWIVLAAAVALSGIPLARTDIVAHRSIAVGLAMLPFETVPLLWRRSRPGLVLGIIAVAFAVSALSGGVDSHGGEAGLAFAIFAAALYGNRRVRIVAGAIAVGALAVGFGTVLATGGAERLGHLAGVAFGSGVAWVAGDRTRTRRAYLAQLEERAAQLERDREEHVRRATDEERSRIARELHDIIAHNVSVIAVQAGAARTTAAANPERAGTTLELIEGTARRTLGELRTLLGVLRRSGEPAPPRQPQPTLAQLDELVALSREAGLHVEVRVEGEVRPVAAIADLCAYRVVQECLTNTMKHAPSAHVNVLVRYGPRDLLLTVVDDGPGLSDAGPAGNGLIGMRERVALAGGTLTVGPALGGGVRVETRLPIDPTEPAGEAPEAPLKAPGKGPDLASTPAPVPGRHQDRA